ncbi:hypothetical protein [Rheinheimera sp. WS51]|uniref:hypothetical protein n=1 Tax=Rheinheimera sp. WS51 TaxID=3425886 RepID=UPI003D8F8BDC
MNLSTLLSRSLLVASLAFTVAACSDNDAETAGEKIDEVVTDVGNKVEDVCEDVKEEAKAKDTDC